MRAGQSGKRGAAVGLLLSMLLTGCDAEDAVQAPAGAGQGVPGMQSWRSCMAPAASSAMPTRPLAHR